MSADANTVRDEDHAVRPEDAIVVMGVSGSGKSTIGTALADRLGWVFLDADDFHPQSNVDKMRTGTPLTDADRVPWLERLRGELDALSAAGDPAVLACSALKKSYRDILRGASARIRFVHLHAGRAELLDRLGGREGHFFPAALLDSQFAALEPPSHPERYLAVAASEPPEVIARAVESALHH